MNAVPSTFAEIMDKDLAGFQFTRLYWMEPNHGLMGQFPALVAKSREPVICRTEELLRRVQEHLPQRARTPKFVPMWALVQVEKGYGFAIDDGLTALSERPPFYILSEAEFERLTMEPEAKPFEWAPGLFGA